MHSNLFYKWPYRNEWTYSGKCLLMTARVLQPGLCWNTTPSNKNPLVQRVNPQTSDIFVFHRDATKTKTASTVLLEDRKGLEDTRRDCVNTWRYLCKVFFAGLSWATLNVLWATGPWTSWSLLTQAVWTSKKKKYTGLLLSSLTPSCHSLSFTYLGIQSLNRYKKI